MAEEPKFMDAVPVNRIFLGLRNPRHEPVDSEAKAIARLCERENVYPLARDIVKHGLNPLESLALVPLGQKKKSGNSSTNYYAAEGNRRICALKLLNDPDLAPANLRTAFERLSEEWDTPITAVPCVVFDDIDALKVWLERIHGGQQGGIGRKDWTSEQKERFAGNKNRAAQAFLDYAEAEKMITPQEREGKLTTVQRFLGNSVFSEMLGFDRGGDGVARTRPKADFDALTQRFISDLIAKSAVNSRMNSDEIIRYARNLRSVPNVSAERVEAEPLIPGGTTKTKNVRRKKPKRPEKAAHVRYEDEIFTALKGLGNEKLASLYHSICSIDLDPHTPMIAVGTWSFFETLTACAGRNEGTSFDSFLSKAKLRGYGIDGDVSSLRDAMERIRSYGNTTKHHKIAAVFNGDQLNNDMIAMKGVIMKCIEEAAGRGA